MKLLKGTNLFVSEGPTNLLGLEDIYLDHKKKVKAMKTNKKIHHLDNTIKGSILGILTYVGMQQGWSEEVIMGLVPVVALALSWVSTKIGDKNTTLLLKLVSEAATKEKGK